LSTPAVVRSSPATLGQAPSACQSRIASDRARDGVALAVQAPDRDAVVALLEDERTGVDFFQDVEIRDWEFGGRR
jgi:hypothetical protein